VPCDGSVLDVVKWWLEDDEDAPRKQRHTAKRVYDRLVDEYGFGGAEITVRQAVAKLRGKRTEAYIPVEAPWGGIAQADFGGAVVTIAGQRTEVSLFCMRAKASKVPFVIAVLSEQHDEWQVSRRYMSAESIAVAMRPPLTALETETEEEVPALMAG